MCVSEGPSVTSRIWVPSGWALIGVSQVYADTPSVEGREGEEGERRGREGKEGRGEGGREGRRERRKELV